MNQANLTKELIVETFKKATCIGSLAANEKVKELAKKKVSPGKLLDACGGSTLTLYVDGRSKVGKTLDQLDCEGIEINKAYGGGYSVILPYNIKITPPVNGQEQSISYAADTAAAEIIKSNLGIKAYASRYDS